MMDRTDTHDDAIATAWDVLSRSFPDGLYDFGDLIVETESGPVTLSRPDLDYATALFAARILALSSYFATMAYTTSNHPTRPWPRLVVERRPSWRPS